MKRFKISHITKTDIQFGVVCYNEHAFYSEFALGYAAVAVATATAAAIVADTTSHLPFSIPLE